jgi:uncharacterized protein YwqG
MTALAGCPCGNPSGEREAEMIDKRIADVIYAIGRETDTPQEIVESVVRRALPSIRLIAQFPKEGEASRLGGCRIGGLPDLPIGVEWPRLSSAMKEYPSKRQSADEPLWFLMQINLAEVASADAANLLPKAGMLYFFFHWHNADEPDEPDASFVLFHRDDERGLQRVEAPADLHWAGNFRGFDLLPYLEWTVPDCDDTNYHLRLWDNLKAPVAEVQGLEATWGPTPVYRMLGYPELLQAPELAEGMELLLQVSSDCGAGFTEVGPYPETGMMWGDRGRIYYIISETDLKSQYFGKVFAFLECQ